MMQMSSWCMPWCECPLVGVPWHECFDANTIYSKIHFIFKTRLPQRLKPKYFQTQFIILEKSSSFWLKAPKKLVITVRKSPNGAFTWNLMIWIKRLIFAIWLSKEMVHFQGPFLEKWIIWKSSILKRFIFVVPEYGNLTSVKTHRDRLENSGGGHSGTRSSNFDFGKGRRTYRGFRCHPVVAFHSSVRSARELSKIFLFLL